MAGNNIRLTSPRGRFVQGDAFEAQTKDQQGAPLTIKTGPNAGQPTKRWFMAVAFSKADPATMLYLMELARFAASAWPMYFPNGAIPTPPLFGCTHPRFSFKIMDGDGVDDNGRPNSAKPGFAGCWIVKYSTSIQAPGVWQEPNFDEMARLTDPRQCPRGYYVRVNHTVQSNDNDQRPGLYVNLDKVALSADQAGAEVIQTGPTAAEAFGGTPSSPPAYAPPSYAPTPAAPAPAYTPAAPTPAPAAPAPAMPSPGSAPAPVAPPPYSGYIPAAPPAAPVRQMLPAANGATYEQMIAAGWTDAMLVQHGMMAAS